MEKIILAIDSGHLDENEVRFACYLTRLTRSRLTAMFLEQGSVREKIVIVQPEGKRPIESIMLTEGRDDREGFVLTERNIRIFTDLTEKEGVHALIEFGNSSVVSEIIGKSRFADLLILNAATSISGDDENPPSVFVKDILMAAECPVIISPDVFNGIDNIVFRYDGSKSSVFAMKQFTYLFPEFKYTRAKIIYFNHDDEFLEEDREAVTEWLSYHYNDVEFVALNGDARHAFVNYLLQKGNDFVVLGPYGRGKLASFFQKESEQDTYGTTSLPIFISHD